MYPKTLYTYAIIWLCGYLELTNKSINDIPNFKKEGLVELDKNKRYGKFLLIEISDQRNRKYILRFCPSDKFHKSIMANLENELKDTGITFSTEGGGFIEINEDARSIYLSGTSKAYGSADMEKVKEILEGHFEGFTIQII